MKPSQEWRSPYPIHHQHHHHHHTIVCPLHHHHHHHCHRHHNHHTIILCPLHHHHHLITRHSHVNPTLSPLSQPIHFNSLSTAVQNEADHSATLASQEQEYEEVVQEEEEEVEPIFVLSDEWREFFAKSEAKRKLGKQQAKKKRKN
ncbi:hypothetical protein CCACVL1_15186 [Corchorus capsularis]|uniref:Uncharacterized protein n=1 Tax=Corchorus capsularis TaxID=210143 RepID=A0A1R3I3P6_COCAP|nr:hypothetical protein CCACVL1_15186 [Corchorus capsularis]